MGRLTNLKKELRALYKIKARDQGERKHEHLQESSSVKLRDFIARRPSAASEEPASGNSTSQKHDRPATAPAGAGTPVKDEATSTVKHESLSPSDLQSPEGHTSIASDLYEISTSNVEPDVETWQDAALTGEKVEDVTNEEDASAESWTFEEEQAVRDTSYVTFISEDLDDYTGGPPRFVFASDGMQKCVAMLLTYDLSARIQTAIQKQREFDQAEAAGLRQRWALRRLQDDVECAYASCKTRLARLENKKSEEQGERESLEQRHAVLEAMLHDVEGRKQRVVAGVENTATILRQVQASVTVYLEEAFVCGLLVNPEEKVVQPETEDFDLEQEYLLFCEKLRTAGDPMVEDDEIVPLNYNTDHLKAEPLSEEDRKRQDIINDVWAAEQTLLQARNAFEDRAAQQAREYLANVAAANENRATTDESPDAFDLRWIRRTQTLTRALIDAEAAYSAAKRVAHDEGVPIEPDGDDQFSGFGDVGGDDDCGGYRMSTEQGLRTSASSPTMRKWLSAVPEGVDVASVGEALSQEADEWEAEEVGISDSVSVVAEGKERARIDRWRSACEKQE